MNEFKINWHDKDIDVDIHIRNTNLTIENYLDLGPEDLLIKIHTEITKALIRRGKRFIMSLKDDNG
jgi:hypothetical protein